MFMDTLVFYRIERQTDKTQQHTNTNKMQVQEIKGIFIYLTTDHFKP